MYRMKGPADDSNVDHGSADNKSSNNSINNRSVDFSEFMWMGEEGVDEFDKKCEAEFVEEELLEHFLEQMMDDDSDSSGEWYGETGTQSSPEIETLYINGSMVTVQDPILTSTKLNPNAPEFVPRCLQMSAPSVQDR